MDAILKTQAEKLAREMATQAKTVDDLNGLMRAMMKSALERMLNTEMDVHLGRRADPADADSSAAVADATRLLDEVQSPAKNRRNGHSRKTVSGDMGDVKLQTPRDRKQYPNAESALKLVYLAIHEASKKWTMPIVGWKAALNHFALLFEDRLPTLTGN
jgi:transposase-like protein